MFELERISPSYKKLGFFSFLFGAIEMSDPQHSMFDKKYDECTNNEDWNSALNVLKEAIEVNPRSPYFHSCLGFLYKIVQDNEHAIIFFKEAIRLGGLLKYSTITDNSYFAMGECFFALNNYDAALSCFQEVLKRSDAHMRKNRANNFTREIIRRQPTKFREI